MIEGGTIANRHLLPADGLRSSEGVNPLSVRIHAARLWAESKAGQYLISCLVNLLCRQSGIVNRVDLALSDTPTLIRIPGVDTQKCFAESLAAMACWAVGDEVLVTSGDSEWQVDHHIVIGCPDQINVVDGGAAVLFAVGQGWRAWIGSRLHAPINIQPATENPMGPFLAATLLAGEFYKRVRGITRGRYLTSSGMSLWSGHSESSWEKLEDGPSVCDCSLPSFHLIGAGAVGHALAYVLGSSRTSDCCIAIIDDDRHDSTNLNRCFLAGLEDVEQPKVDALARFLNASGVTVSKHSCTLSEYLAQSNTNSPMLAKETDTLNFGLIVSCVDKGISRQHIQGLWPRLIIGGSTLNLVARSNIYQMSDGNACLACHNPAEKDGERIREYEARLRLMSTTERRTFLQDKNLPFDSIEEYLRSPTCGSDGETALRSFAEQQQPRQFSVSFVSMGAGLLLASALFRNAVFLATAPSRASMNILSYLKGEVKDSEVAIDANCELNCLARRNVPLKPSTTNLTGLCEEVH